MIVSMKSKEWMVAWAWYQARTTQWWNVVGL